MQENTEKTVGRNEPCPCGSGKKYKRCHGINAAPKLTPPSWAPPAGEAGSDAGAAPANPLDALGGMDPQMMMQMMQAMQRLPKGHIQKIQALMQKAMAGKDVTREAQELERSLPPSFLEMMKGMQLPAGFGGEGAPELEAPALPVASSQAAPATGEMTPEQAKAIVEQAVAEGRLKEDQAKELLAAAAVMSQNPEAHDATPESPVEATPEGFAEGAQETPQPAEPQGEPGDQSGFSKLWKKIGGGK